MANRPPKIPEYAILSCLKKSSGETWEVEIRKSPFKIGRSPDNDLELEDKERIVSALHISIEKQTDGYYLEDFSTNGTWLNFDQPIKGKIGPLLAGSVITLCRDSRYQITFLYPNAATPDLFTTTDEVNPALLFNRITARLGLAETILQSHIYQHKVLLLVGPSGTGKTKMLQALESAKFYSHIKDTYRSGWPWKKDPLRLYLELRDLRQANTQVLTQQLIAHLSQLNSAGRAGSSYLLTNLDELEPADQLLEALAHWQKANQTPLILMLDGIDKLLALDDQRFWLNLCRGLKELDAEYPVCLIISSQQSLERMYSNAALSGQNSYYLKLLGQEYRLLRLGGLSKAEGLLVAQACLVTAFSTSEEEVESLQKWTVYYRNRQMIDITTFNFIAERVAALGGNYPGLIRVIAKPLLQKLEPPREQARLDLTFLGSNPSAELALINELLKNEQVKAACQLIFESLSASQQMALSRIAFATARYYGLDINEALLPQPANLNYNWNEYQERGLLTYPENNQQPQVFSPLFALYLVQTRPQISKDNPDLTPTPPPQSINQTPEQILDTVRQKYSKALCWLKIQRERQAVSICGLPEITIKAPGRWKLFDYLAQNHDKLVTKEELIKHLFYNNPTAYVYERADEENLDKQISLLRKQIEPWSAEREWVFLKNVPGSYGLYLGQPR